MNVAETLRENERRWKVLNAPYDPMWGIGSSVKRRPFLLNEKSEVLLPEPMFALDTMRTIKKHGTLERAAKASGSPYTHFLRQFNRFRVKHDFEFWSASCVTIQVKDPKGADALSLFILNHPQRRMVAFLEEMRVAGVPIRVILLKARQWGGSTLVQLYIAWLQNAHTPGRNALVIADAKDKALHIRAMYRRMVEHHPKGVFDHNLELEPYERTINWQIIKGRNAIVGVTSVESTEAPRSFTLHYLHLSEIGLWQATEKIKPADLIQSLEGGIPLSGNTLVCKESTGKGVGNLFHRSWLAAVNGETADKPFFVPWFEGSEYTLSVESPAEFVKSLTPYDEFQWEKGATLEHIRWYREKLRTMPAEDNREWRMKAEYPTTPEESFQSTGQRVFDVDVVLKARRTCKPPLAIGDLSADGIKGKAAFQGITFSPAPDGRLRIWTFPGKAGVERLDKLYKNRYCAFLDTGGRGVKADFNSLTVLDRIFTIFGGTPYVAAELHCHMDADLAGWYAARICKWYEDALLAVEVNKLYERSGEEGQEPEYGVTVLNEIKEFYENLYYRVRPETIQERWDGVLGFHTNQETKPMLITTLRAAMREEGYEERAQEACDEFDMYEYKADGRKMGAKEGQHDDRVISRSGAVWLSGKMDPVVEVDAPRPKPRNPKGIILMPGGLPTKTRRL